MEYVIVTYPADREVLLDGQPAGRTNRTLLCGAGHHRFTLGDPQDFTPAERECDIQGTTPLSPQPVAFLPL